MGGILVTGGSGYVGGRLVERLAGQGRRVRVATRGAADPFRDLGVETVRIDWSGDGDLDRACAGMDAVIHLAAMNEVGCARDPVAALEVNGGQSLRLLEAAIRTGVGRFVYFSTAHVYGAPLAGTITEAIAPRPVHPYSITHRTAEDFVLAAHDLGRIGGLVLRLSNAIGAPAASGADRWTVLVNDLCRQAAETGRMALKSSGMQRRDFVPLADVADAVVHLLGLPVAAWGDGVFNLGLGRSKSVAEMAQIAARLADVPLDRPDPAPGETAPDLDYRIDRLRGTGFVPAGDIEAAVAETLDYCRAHFPARTA